MTKTTIIFIILASVIIYFSIGAFIEGIISGSDDDNAVDSGYEETLTEYATLREKCL